MLHSVQITFYSRMDEAHGFWKKLFFLLHNNSQPDSDLPYMWAQFKANNLQKSDITTALENVGDQLRDEVRSRLESILSDETANCLDLMKNCPQFEDDFWCLLFSAIRDRESTPISSDKKVPILEGGQLRFMTVEEIERKFESEQPDILTSRTCIPDQMIHDDMIDAPLSTDMAREELRSIYKRNYLKAKEAFNQPKVNEQEKEKQVDIEARQETNQTREAKALQYRVAMKAEDYVQKSIKRAIEKFKIPVFIFRGVNTYQDIGRFLGEFGIQMSKLKAFKTRDTEATEECEHDSVILALPSTGPIVSFLQVISTFWHKYWCF